MTQEIASEVRCEVCGHPLPGPGTECPNCGSYSDVSAILPDTDRRPPVTPERPRLRSRPLLYGVLIAAGLLLFLAAAGAYGVYSGLQERERIKLTTVAEHYHRGVASLEVGDYALAVAEFEYVERIRPGYLDTGSLLEQSRKAMLARPTPTSQAREEVAASLLSRAQDEMEQEAWSKAIATLREVQNLAPDYKAEQVQTFLFQSMYGAGAQALEADDVAVALEWFRQALELNPDSVDVRRQVTLASLYLQAADAWGHDWPTAVERLAHLYSLSPAYADTEDRLATAYVRYGDQLSSEGSWCQAAEQYALASDIRRSPTVDTKASLAERYCQEPPIVITPGVTGTPGATPSPTSPESGALASLPGQGKLYFTLVDPQTGVTGIYTLAAGPGQRPELLIPSGEQPSVRDDGYLAYHNLAPDRLGVSIAARDGTFTSTASSHAEDQYPTWEPGNGRLAFASTRESDRKWRLYVSESWFTGGDATSIGYGKSPDWGPDGTLVYRGCDPTGNNCGLYLGLPDGTPLGRLTDNPNDDMPVWSPDGTRVAFSAPRSATHSIWVTTREGRQPTRITDDQGLDAAPAWSPDGRYLAFLSNRGGEWGIWVVEATGGTPRQVLSVGQVPGSWDLYRMDWR
ncbi:MAG: hypothetical protein HPY83_00725 [Anaerolineae bacterium]|nr:hypothetical protein [Anaerolineae bacterium]